MKIIVVLDKVNRENGGENQRGNTGKFPRTERNTFQD